MNKTIEELLELASKHIPTAVDLPDSYSDVEKFIMLNQIKTDYSKRVPVFIIYELYYVWCESNSLKPKNSNNFFKKFSKLFEKKNSNGKVVYMIDAIGMDMTMLTTADKEFYKKMYDKRKYSNVKKGKKE
jgi:hypothetical protein